MDDMQPPLHPPDLHGLDPRALLLRGIAPGGGAGDWTPPSVAELAPLFPDYQIEALLGRGAMGAVYHARQPSLDRLVAIKLLPLEISADEEIAARFRREARALARLQHPHIIAVHDFGTTSEGHLFFVMEYVEGTDLAQLLSAGRLDVAQALDVVRQVCEALQFAHAQGVIHRDIKPANVLVDRHGQVKVGDFGLAKLTGLEDERDQTRAHASLGTPDYTAPEQWRGKADHRADIYSLGVMFYEMLTGEVPHGVFDPPSKKAPVDAGFDPVVLRAMQEEPERRYQQAVEFRADVDRVSTSRQSGPSTAFRKTISCLLAAALMGIVAFAIRSGPKSSAPSKSSTTLAKSNAPPPWINSLGMKFIPLGSDGLQMSVWETRVRDFQEFATRTGFDTQWGLYTLIDGEWTMVPSKLNWREPGFEQTPDHPVCGADWNMAQQFCRWLTEREHAAGLLSNDKAHYRLPTDEEWTLASAPPDGSTTLAVTSTGFPWGEAFPPPAGTGNFAGEEVLDAPWPKFPTLQAYRDGHRTTAPVGSFRPNPRGLADLAGNVWEWCQDGPSDDAESRWLRGGSWIDGSRKSLRDTARTRAIRQTRTAAYGFRIVLAPR